MRVLALFEDNMLLQIAEEIIVKPYGERNFLLKSPNFVKS